MNGIKYKIFANKIKNIFRKKLEKFIKNDPKRYDF